MMAQELGLCAVCYPAQARQDGSVARCREHRLEDYIRKMRTPFCSTLSGDDAKTRLREINRLTYEALEN
jgi:hypothetical protein